MSGGPQKVRLNPKNGASRPRSGNSGLVLRAGQSGSYKMHRSRNSELLQENAVGGGLGEGKAEMGQLGVLVRSGGLCRGGPGVLAGGAAP